MKNLSISLLLLMFCITSSHAKTLFYDGFEFGLNNEDGEAQWYGPSSQYNEVQGNLEFGKINTTNGFVKGPYISLKRMLKKPITLKKPIFVGFIMQYDSYAGNGKDSGQRLILNDPAKENSISIGYTHSLGAAPVKITATGGPPTYPGLHSFYAASKGQKLLLILKLEAMEEKIKVDAYVVMDQNSIPRKEPITNAAAAGSFEMNVSPENFSITELNLNMYGITGSFDEIRIGTKLRDVAP